MSEFRKEDYRKFETLVRVVARLRSPDGCPWDREQTSRTLRQFAVEEAYEVVEAIDADDLDRLREELGDLLLQIILHARIAEESGAFAIDDVIEGITEKLIRRHVWVFGDETAESPAAALRTWNKIKVDEKGGADNGASILDGVPRVLPALFKAFSITRRAAQVGFDWQAAKDLFAKIKEELFELEETLQGSSDKRVEEELGDLLFVLANLARHLDINPELALEGANRKFIRRFRYIEQRLAEEGRTPHDASLEEMDALWNEFKYKEKNGGLQD
jgi:tetrapyrrole methylase family protein/MazG family protein